MRWIQAKPMGGFNHTNTSSNKNTTSIKKPVEIYVFIDPLCSVCWSLEPYLTKLSIEYGRFFTIRTIINCHLKSLNTRKFDRIQDASESSSIQKDPTTPSLYSWVSLAIKAAELQGKNAGKNFLRKIQEYYFLKKLDVTDKEVILRCAKVANLDVQEFKNDLFSVSAKNAFQCDLKITKEMDVTSTPTVVFFNQMVDEQGVKVSGLYTYDIYVSILKEMLQKDPKPAEKPPLEDFLALYGVVAKKEISIVYDWSPTETARQMKKLQIKQKVQKIPDKNEILWKYVN